MREHGGRAEKFTGRKRLRRQLKGAEQEGLRREGVDGRGHHHALKRGGKGVVVAHTQRRKI